MTVVLWILVKATVVLMLGLTAVRLSGRARAAVRGAMLTCTFGALLALPIAAALAPSLTVNVPIPETGRAGRWDPTVIAGTPQHASRAAEMQVGTTPLGASLSAATVVRMVWAAGTMLFLATLAGALWRIRRTRGHGLPWPAGDDTARALATASGVRRQVAVLLHEDVSAPLVCGLVRPTILLPRDAREWAEHDLRRAIVHELEHVRRGDWLTQLVARAICAAYWFHPLAWFAWRRLRLECERACDDAVVSRAEHADYAEQLVMLAERLSRSRSHPALAMAGRSDLSVRVAALLDVRQQRGRAGRAAVVAIASAAALSVGLIAPVRVAAVSRAPAGVAAGAQAGRGDAVTEALNARLLEVAERGDLARVTELLNGGADVNATVSGDGTPLIVAARHGRAPVVRLLLARGADPDLAVPGDGNPLIMAARGGHLDIIAMLLDRGADIERVVPEDENALIGASAEGHLDAVKLLVARGANVNGRAWSDSAPRGAAGEWRTPLNMARRAGHEAIVQYLRSMGASD
jgi:bla regulator protein blaR1